MDHFARSNSSHSNQIKRCFRIKNPHRTPSSFSHIARVSSGREVKQHVYILNIYIYTHISELYHVCPCLRKHVSIKFFRSWNEFTSRTEYPSMVPWIKNLTTFPTWLVPRGNWKWFEVILSNNWWAAQGPRDSYIGES